MSNLRVYWVNHAWIKLMWGKTFWSWERFEAENESLQDSVCDLSARQPVEGKESMTRQLIECWGQRRQFRKIIATLRASLVAQLVRNLPAIQGTQFYPWAGKIRWRREQPPIPIFWLGEIHGTVQGVTQSQTQLSPCHFHFRSNFKSPPREGMREQAQGEKWWWAQLTKMNKGGERALEKFKVKLNR